MPYLRSLLPFGSLPAALLWLGCSTGDPGEPEGSTAGATGGESAGGAGDGPGTAGGDPGGKGGQGAGRGGNANGGEGPGAAGDGGTDGGDAGSGGGGMGGSSTEGGNSGAAGSAAEQTCTEITNDAAVASFTRSTSAVVSPAPSGGAILGGTYRASAVTFYGALSSCADADDVRSTVVITPSGTGTGTWESVTESNGVERRERKRFTVDGSKVKLSLECAAPLAGAKNLAEYRYTATATELRLYDDAPPCGSTVGTVYALEGAVSVQPSTCKADAAGSACGDDQGCTAAEYTVNDDGTVSSSCCGLEWQQDVVQTEASWASAASYCAGLGLAGGGWRLPTLAEILSLAVEGSTSSLDPVAFPGSVSDYYWTATPWSGGATSACAVLFSAAAIAGPWPVTASYRVRCVR